MQRVSATLITGLMATALLAGGLLATAPAQAATESRATAPFQAIVSGGAFELQVRQADRVSVELEGDEAVLAQIETTVEDGDGGTLQIRPRRGARLSGFKAPVVRIGLPTLTAVTLQGAGDLKLDSFQTPQLRVAINGAGSAALKQLTSERVAFSIAGSGDIRADGRVPQVQLNIAGSGDGRLQGLVADRVSVSIAGAGSAQVRAEQALDVSIAGSGDVRYLGNPVVKRSILGSGQVQPLR